MMSTDCAFITSCACLLPWYLRACSPKLERLSMLYFQMRMSNTSHFYIGWWRLYNSSRKSPRGLTRRGKIFPNVFCFRHREVQATGLPDLCMSPSFCIFEGLFHYLPLTAEPSYLHAQFCMTVQIPGMNFHFSASYCKVWWKVIMFNCFYVSFRNELAVLPDFHLSWQLLKQHSIPHF